MNIEQLLDCLDSMHKEERIILMERGKQYDAKTPEDTLHTFKIAATIDDNEIRQILTLIRIKLARIQQGIKVHDSIIDARNYLAILEAFSKKLA